MTESAELTPTAAPEHEPVDLVEEPSAADETSLDDVDSADDCEETPADAAAFRELGLDAPLVRAVEDSGYLTPTPIQEQTIPLLLAGRDVLGQAQTGTGKTGAFALPLLQRIDRGSRQTQVLVLAPTRELAIQVAEAFERYGNHLHGLRVAAIYGGQNYDTQFRQLSRGAHVVVGTPGRVMDHLRRGSLKLDELQCLVLDEADEMLRMGFAEDVQWILQHIPASRQTALFSATMPEAIRRIAAEHLRGPAHVTIAQRVATADTVRQRYIVASPRQKADVLGRILEAEATDGVIVFVKMKSTTEPLVEMLARHGLKAAALNGDLPQKQRERIVDQLRRGAIDVIVATDVAARGLDVSRISHVINYDLPFDHESYVHRIGRTGRAGRNGEAILFVSPRERRSLQRLEQATRQRIEPMELPKNRDINKQRVARFHDRITAALAHRDLEKYASVIEQYRRNNEIDADTLLAAMAVLAGGDKPLFVTEELRPTVFSESPGKRSASGRFEDRRSPAGKRFRDKEGRPRDKESRPREKAARGRDERPAPKSRRPRQSEQGMETFRIEVGHAHQVRPANIVGAIASEAGLDSSFIGRIDIFDRYSTVDLPQGMPTDLFHVLKNVRVAGQRLNISRMKRHARETTAAPRGKA